MKRVIHAFQPAPESGLVRSKEAFQLEVAKEISRSNRREQQREFSLIHFPVYGKVRASSLSPAMLESFHQRIRISDTLGWHSANLALLLPETDREGAKLVAGDLAQLAERHGWNADPEVYVYPWDDKLISMSNEVAQASNDSDSNGSGHELLKSSEFADGFERVDSYHSGQFESGRSVDSDFNRNGLSNGNGFDKRSAADDSGSSAVQVVERVASRSIEETNGLSAGVATVVDLPLKTGSAASQRATLSPAAEARLNAVASSMSTAVIPVLRAPWWKRAIDIVGAGTGLVLLSPVLLAAAVAIKVSSPGPVLFKQKREGLGGRQFDILKFRTMVFDAEEKQASLRDVSEQDGPAFKLKNDPRITAVGVTLRKSCIDELPQLVNVLVGQMSLVGPRPLPVSESIECAAWQRMRLTVLPGLTCTWQARGGRNVSFDQWMRMDLDYIKNRGFVTDARLIIETAFIALLQRGSV
ncbi:sugar transferase [Mariniblastus sp.]|nr:sugar transferase [Mariniblastus sp.]